MNENLINHFNHPFYKKVDKITDEVKETQIKKGAEKYPEPFTPSSWTGKELAIHALQELRDGQVYVVGLLERIEELEEALKFYANEENYVANERSADGLLEIDNDQGNKARIALEVKP
ncbi:hypothetical protein [Oceanobacillus sp. Castelsardo]|uniref:hypothetical protein n=1 Tax=Oceanobacillus sp. Castelsardo TaxID=1851204 RepID=UPI000837E895|nr:hypothetical protein [Oceanobacillus sp. Castelsardo]